MRPRQSVYRVTARDHSKAEPKAEDDKVEDLIDFTQEKKKKKKKKDKESKFDGVAEIAEHDMKMEKANEKAKKEVEITSRINLNEVEGHETFSYDFLLKRIVETIKQTSGDEDAGTLKLIKP